jgi:hypothetical protein
VGAGEVGGGERDLDAKLIRAMRLAFANAFDLRGVQGIDPRDPEGKLLRPR